MSVASTAWSAKPLIQFKPLQSESFTLTLHASVRRTLVPTVYYASHQEN